MVIHMRHRPGKQGNAKEQEGEGHNVDRWSWRLQAILSVVEGFNPRTEEHVQFACKPDKDEG